MARDELMWVGEESEAAGYWGLGSLLASRAERPHTARHAELRAVITCTQIHRKFRKDHYEMGL